MGWRVCTCFHQTWRAAAITSALLLASVIIAARAVAKVRQAQQVMICCSLSATMAMFQEGRFAGSGTP